MRKSEHPRHRERHQGEQQHTAGVADRQVRERAEHVSRSGVVRSPKKIRTKIFFRTGRRFAPVRVRCRGGCRHCSITAGAGNQPETPRRPGPGLRRGQMPERGRFLGCSPRLTRCAALLGRPADPGGEQVTEADHAVDLPTLHDGQMAEAVQEHDLSRVLDRRVPAR